MKQRWRPADNGGGPVRISAAQVRKLRDAVGSCAGLARALGLGEESGRTSVSRWVYGHASPSQESTRRIIRLAAARGVIL